MSLWDTLTMFYNPKTYGAGGDSSATNPNKGTTDTISTLSPEQQAIMTPLANYLKTRVGTGLPSYTGQRTAGMSDSETQALGLLKDYLSAPNSSLGGPTTSALTQLLGGQPSSEINPALTQQYFQNAIEAPARARFAQETLPSITEGFVGQGLTHSTARLQAEQKAQRDLEQNLTATQAGLVYQDEQNRRALAESAASRQLSAAGIAPQQGQAISDQTLKKATAGETLGALPRTLEQTQMDTVFNEFIRTSPEMSPVIAQAMQALGLSTTAAFYTPPLAQPDYLGQILQAGTLAAVLKK